MHLFNTILPWLFVITMISVGKILVIVWIIQEDVNIKIPRTQNDMRTSFKQCKSMTKMNRKNNTWWNTKNKISVRQV